jgi:hypothetical protein
MELRVNDGKDLRVRVALLEQQISTHATVKDMRGDKYNFEGC